jgi:hypothetical protein
VSRGENGRFLPGNAGRPPGAVSEEKRSLAAVCRELVEGSENVYFEVKGKGRMGLLELVTTRVGALRPSAAGVALQIEFLKLMLAYGWGKPPQKVILESEDDSPDAILRRAMEERNRRLSEGGGAVPDGRANAGTQASGR